MTTLSSSFTTPPSLHPTTSSSSSSSNTNTNTNINTTNKKNDNHTSEILSNFMDDLLSSSAQSQSPEHNNHNPNPNNKFPSSRPSNPSSSSKITNFPYPSSNTANTSLLLTNSLYLSPSTLTAITQTLTTALSTQSSPTSTSTSPQSLATPLRTILVNAQKEVALEIQTLCTTRHQMFLSTIKEVRSLLSDLKEVRDEILENTQYLQDLTISQFISTLELHVSKSSVYNRAKVSNRFIKCLVKALKKVGKVEAMCDGNDVIRGLSLLLSIYDDLLQPILNAKLQAANATFPSTLSQSPPGVQIVRYLPILQARLLNKTKKSLTTWFNDIRSCIGEARGLQCIKQGAFQGSILNFGGCGIGSYLNFDSSDSSSVGGNDGDCDDCDDDERSDRSDSFVYRPNGFGESVEGFKFGYLSTELLVNGKGKSVILNVLKEKESASSSSSSSAAAASKNELSSITNRLSKHPPGLHLEVAAFSEGFGFNSNWGEESDVLGMFVNGEEGEGGEASGWSCVLLPSVLLDTEGTSAPSSCSPSSPPSSTSSSSSSTEIPLHPVHQAHTAYTLLNLTASFHTYYSKNRYGKTQTLPSNSGALNSLTGEDVFMSCEREGFYEAMVPKICCCVCGFAAVEAAVARWGEDAIVLDSTDVDDGGGGDYDVSDDAPLKESERYEKSLIHELSSLINQRTLSSSSPPTTLLDLSRLAKLLLALRYSLLATHPSSRARDFDGESLAGALEIGEVRRIAIDEMRTVCDHLLKLDKYEGVLKKASSSSSSNSTSPLPLPFGLNLCVASSSTSNPMVGDALDMLDPSTSLGRNRKKNIASASALEDSHNHNHSHNHDSNDLGERHTFSSSIPQILKSIHARSLALGWIAKCHLELAPLAASPSWSRLPVRCAADFIACCAGLIQSAVGVNFKDRLPLSQAVQLTANATALKLAVPGLIAAVARGTVVNGLMSTSKESVDDYLKYTDECLRKAQLACDRAFSSVRDASFEISRSKIDALISFNIDPTDFNPASTSSKNQSRNANAPSDYADQLINYLRVTFSSLDNLSIEDKEGFCFSCCGHIANRIMRLLIGGAGAFADDDGDGDSGNNDNGSSNGSSNNNNNNGFYIEPIVHVNSFGIMNLSLDVLAFSAFADGCGVPQLSECFREMRGFTDALLDRDLAFLCDEGNADERMSKYPMLDIIKLQALLEKYVGVSASDKAKGAKSKSEGHLMLEKKDIAALLKKISGQI